MIRRSLTRPEILLGGVTWLSSIVPVGWGDLVTKTRPEGDWEASWSIPLDAYWRHPALVAGAAAQVTYGPQDRFVGTLDEPDWDAGRFTARGVAREVEGKVALDGSGVASTAPNTVIDAAIARGALNLTRDFDFGTTPVGQADDAGTVVTLRSVLDAWSQTTGQQWKITRDRRLTAYTPSESSPSYFITPGAGVLGTTSDGQVDRVFVRYVADSTGTYATASYPASTPANGIEQTADITDRGPMSAAEAVAVAQSIWGETQGRSGWTNGFTLLGGQVTTPGGVVVDLSVVEAGQAVHGLGIPDPRGLDHSLDVVLAETTYTWAEDTLQANPVGLADRTTTAVLEQVGEIAVDALQRASAAAGADAGYWPSGTASLAGTTPVTGSRILVRANTAVVTVSGTSTVTVPFPIAFPRGLVSVVASSGDAAAGGLAQVIPTSYTTSGFTANVRTATGANLTTGVGVRVNYVATGW